MVPVPEFPILARLRETWLFLFPTHLKRSTVAGVFFLVLIRNTSAVGQLIAGGTFGLVSFSNIPDEPSLPLAGKFSSSSLPEFIYYDQMDSSLVVLSTNEDGAVAQRREIGHTSDATFLAVGDLNHDGIDDVVVVHRERNEIQIFLSSVQDSVFATAVYKVGFYPERAMIADIDDDKNPDIMVYGKLSSGISVLRSDGRGSFRDAENIFPDIPVANVAVVKLNDDEFPDLVIHNWLTNEYLFYFGMGDLQFSQQNVLLFGQDSVSVFFGDFDGDFITDFGVAFLQKNILELYHGDGMVNFEHYQTLEYTGSPDHFFLLPIRSRTTEDIVAGDQRNGTFGVFANSGDGKFKDEMIFGCPSNYTALLPGDFDGDGWDDLAVIEQATKEISFYWNAHRSAPLHTQSGEISLAAGKTPSGIAIGDFDRDGRDDIAVVNAISSTISIFHNTKSDNYFTSQTAFPTVESPSAVRVYAQSDSSVTFLISHESGAKVSVLTMGLPSRSEQNNGTISLQDFSSQPKTDQLPAEFTYSIPTAERPRVFLPDASLQDKTIEFYVYSSARQNSLSYFRQVSGTRFIERSFKPVIPSRLLAAAVNDYNDDGKPDLAYIYYETGTGKYNLGITFSDSAGEYRGKTLSYVFPDSVMKRCYLTFADINGDGIRDCILYSAPSNMIRLALGKGGGRFGDFSVVMNDILITQPDQIQIVDFDGDGINDIVVQNGKTSQLLFLKGKGNGTFYSPKFLLDLPPYSVFRFGDFNGDGVYDIAYTDPERNVVTIYFVKGKR